LRAHVEEPPPLPTEINPQIRLEVEDIILRALEKDPAGRYATTTDFLRAIRTARERDAGDVVEAGEAQPKTYRPVGTHELHETADNTVRRLHHAAHPQRRVRGVRHGIGGGRRALPRVRSGTRRVARNHQTRALAVEDVEPVSS
jgi:hypothetical protein